MVGLAAEARIARRLGPAEAGGGTPDGAAAAAERLAAAGVRGLVSFGLAGGLDPALRPGDIVVPGAVVEDGADHPVDAALAAALGGVPAGRVLAAAGVLADPAAKRAAFVVHGAAIVDLESGAVARVAARRGLPFAVLRAVCDPATRGLPPAALVALDGAGAIGVGRVALSLLRDPRQLPLLLRLAVDAARARRALAERVAQLVRGWPPVPPVRDA